MLVSALTPEQILALVDQPPAAASDAEAIIQACADLYDDRSGPIEHSFGENHQALPLGQRHRRRFVVQEALLLLLSLAANTLVWLHAWSAPAYPPITTWGLLRLSRDRLPIPGCVPVDATGRIVQIQFNALDPLAMRVVPAWQRLLHPYAVAVETISLESLQPHRSALGDFGRN